MIRTDDDRLFRVRRPPIIQAAKTSKAERLHLSDGNVAWNDYLGREAAVSGRNRNTGTAVLECATAKSGRF